MVPQLGAVDFGAEAVLVVDDEPAVRRFISRALSAGGRAVETYATADEALERVRRGGCAVALVDLRMPGHDGLWFIDRVHEVDEDLMAIMVTGNADVRTAIECLTRGAFHYIIKPVDVSELNLVLQRALDNRRLRLENKAYRLELERLVEERTQQLARTLSDLQVTQQALETSYRESLYRLATAAEYRDEETGNHIRRLGHFSRIIAKRWGADEQFLELIFLASPMHDLGKIGIRDSVLLKPGPLTREEFEEIKLHTLIGERILSGSQSPLLRLAEEIAATHHERWDGSGYPRGLAGEAIPLGGRIVAVADVFDALTSNRVYRPAYSVEDALSIMETDRAGFDPEVFRAFREGLPEILVVRAEYADRQPLETVNPGVRAKLT